MRDATTAQRHYTKPWTLRAYEALPGNVLSVGSAFTVSLLALFLTGRVLTGAAEHSTPEELWVAIVHILQTGYTASAYAYLLVSARRATQELAPLAEPSPATQKILQQTATHPWWALLLVGAGFALGFGIPVTYATSPDVVDPWSWQGWSYEIWWHRVSSVAFNWWTACLFYVMVAESRRLSRLTDEIDSLDLLELTPYQPLIRQGLTNALLMIGVASLASLLVVESRYWSMLMGVWITGVITAWIGLMLPLRGIRRKIRDRKTRELAWCREQLKAARDSLKSESGPSQAITELVAYQSVIENARKWPFDNPTLIRFSLYLLIPLGSWLGGAFVERGLDLFLS